MRLIAAMLISAALVLSAPFVGDLRAWMREAFPGRFGTIVNAGIGAAVGLALLVALLRIREQRARRYLCLASAIVVAAMSAWATAGPSASSNAVERFHFVAYGTITFAFYRAFRRRRGAADSSLLILPALAALSVSIADEWLQWFVPERVGEWRDLWLNATAIGAGLLFSLGADPPPLLQRRLTSPSRRLVAGMGAVTVLLAAAFLHAVHLGHLVSDAEAGAFRSRYDEARLLALRAVRGASWASEPPPIDPPRFSREDQYVAEAIWHIRARNRAWDVDIDRAWRENLILEKYFDPVLDYATNMAPASRWPPEQRADAERRAHHVSGSEVVSGAEPLPLYLWSPAVLWTLAGGAAALLLFVGSTRRRGEDLNPSTR